MFRVSTEAKVVKCTCKLMMGFGHQIEKKPSTEIFSTLVHNTIFLLGLSFGFTIESSEV